jgi:hypothetical protein
MTEALRIDIGQHSEAGRKPLNQDFHGAVVPKDALLATKGVVLALADGISSSPVSQVASAAAVRGFLEDYYLTSETWPVRRAAQRVLQATNSWLHAQTQRGEGRFDKNRGHVCTFSALVFKGREAHLLHVGDTRDLQAAPSGTGAADRRPPSAAVGNRELPRPGPGHEPCTRDRLPALGGRSRRDLPAGHRRRVRPPGRCRRARRAGGAWHRPRRRSPVPGAAGLGPRQRQTT